MVKHNVDGKHDIEMNSSTRKAGPSKADCIAQMGLVVITNKHPTALNSFFAATGKVMQVSDQTVEPNDYSTMEVH